MNMNTRLLNYNYVRLLTKQHNAPYFSQFPSFSPIDMNLHTRNDAAASRNPATKPQNNEFVSKSPLSVETVDEMRKKAMHNEAYFLVCH